MRLVLTAGERKLVVPQKNRHVQVVYASINLAIIRLPSEQGGEDRLASLEEKVNAILNGSRSNRGEHAHEDVSESSYSANTHPSCSDPGYTLNDMLSLGFGLDSSNQQPPHTSISRGLDLYFEYCHRQPIWCFDREDVEDTSYLPEELACSILALTSRFSRDRDRLQHYGDSARSLIMLRVANGTVELGTIESLCLLSYSSFVDGNMQLGRFYLGLSFQLCRSAMLDFESAYTAEDPMTERKRRLFWSLQSLEQTYGQQNGFLSVPTDILRPVYVSTCSDGLLKEPGSKHPPFPNDEIGCSTSSDIGIWNLAAHINWVWSRVRAYIADCAQNRLKEPWRHDSMYSMVLSDLTEIENKLSLCHRYESVKFYERETNELEIMRDYWSPWLKLQFTYHSILTVLNHPFLYIVASQHNPNLAIPNAFWRRSSEQVLLHATWIVRMIDMVSDKNFRLIDPFFGHAAAIAATVHLYYCCAADPRLKHKSKADFTKCRRFLKSFVSFSPACAGLDRSLDKMTRIASGSDNLEFDWAPGKIHLSIPLMWDVLEVNPAPDPQEMSTSGLLHPSLAPTASRVDLEESSSSTLEIIVAMSPEVTVNTADGGQAVHIPPRMPKVSSTPVSPSTMGLRDVLVAPADSLMSNTPWLWTDPTQFDDLESLEYQDSESTVPNLEGFSTWWDYGNL
ncbi:Aromatic-ring-hydroxylating dioxygenase alpha subunit [Penicillium lagena]|uniref:Aromatic-ring-hydroxylating dioxygenase alpha subunit n=1 Tax=Penicillium lagena TaxID=94218 RepID=UPI00254162C5|nr:Aromatic-ring-hydroxylating dioxygenase alpha subunit [Penicillium lagena]KAJ5612256.1 Aromatic-ring-hydroxylating dioxygenase alpha subunit [Penicillium lagena]